MSDDRISVPYNLGLKPLEAVLSGVSRPGDFYVQGSLETPMPRVEVEGVGVISFPVPEAQIRQIVQQAARAPYGRGEETLQDESVRKTWQLAASQVRIGGKTWEKTFSQILAKVVDGLGCGEAKVSAELYKLLVYDPGGFFATHRDTEKAGGMFGTLTVALPSAHRGGELVIRHAGREAVADLSSEEFSELRFAAFYADCEHELRPVTEGYRVSLIFNLIQLPDGAAKEPLNAPLYVSEIETASGLLKEAFAASNAPAKLAWLLEHQYSPASLSFAGLKGEDAAVASVLRAAAGRAECAAHLGIIHIEESGPAQPNYYDQDYGYGRRGPWRGRSDEGEDEENASSDSFEVVEVSESSRHIDQWVNARDQPIAYGKLPLEDGEVLPAGALDGAVPDEQRLTEATGNEGASFSRAYHRAALVIWPRDRFAQVLIQAGAAAALPHLAERLDAGDKAAAAIAEQIIEAWEQPPAAWSHRGLAKEPSSAEMLRLLTKLGDRGLLRRCISGVVTREFDGSEHAEIATAAKLLGPREGGELLTALVRENFPLFHSGCVNLLGGVLRELGEEPASEWHPPLRETAAVMVAALPAIGAQPNAVASLGWRRGQKVKPPDAGMAASLLELLGSIGADALWLEAAAKLAALPALFDPGKVIVPALTLLHEREGLAFASDASAGRLWVHAAEFLLSRGESPPAPPSDWRQDVKLSCGCEDCRDLQAFALDPGMQAARFRVRQDRRQHLHRQIERHGLDMTHATERKGSPQTLVCVKTRASYQRQCEQHRADCASMSALLQMMQPAPDALAKLIHRLTVAKDLKPASCG